MLRIVSVLLVLVAASFAFAQDEKKEEAEAEKLYRAFSEPVPVGPFKLRDRGGDFVQDRDLVGKVWVVQFFYPGCNLCSRNTPSMQRLQEIYRGKSDVRLVSIDLADSLKTFAPDTLDEFAKTYEAEPGQWLMLTGPEDKVHEVVWNGFANPVERDKNATVGNEIIHTTYLILVDRNGNMVGRVDGTKDGAVDALKEQIDSLRTRRRMEERIPIVGGDLPRFNALLNSTCTILLLLGWIAIRTGYQTVHKMLMLSALAVSAVFLASYLFYHFAVMGMEPTRFQGEGAARYVYFAILLSHTVLAIAVAPLAIFITVQGLRNALITHVKLARWTLPIWLYVSVTGVVVYWMLYRVAW